MIARCIRVRKMFSDETATDPLKISNITVLIYEFFSRTAEVICRYRTFPEQLRSKKFKLNAALCVALA
ncbi:unnamed protein product [Gongylonema pulchrum]|uniref:G_PROTEIN_RECEP_F1_2 domain-containing protein n=1 Tax=Gongylonema pulchrum TaxID=637853 RepID=A0A183EJ03_9BILA|nr:unnamed protein product [Gongylonema pulchrum]